MKCTFLNTSCRMQFDRYRSTNNIAVQLVVDDPDGSLSAVYDGEPFLTVTANLNVLPDDRIAIKTWEENDGLPELLSEIGFIEAVPCELLAHGYVQVPVHKLTEAGIFEIRLAGLS